MKIIGVKVPTWSTILLTCVKCGREVDASRQIMFADIGGVPFVVPFVDYYCESCVNLINKEAEI